MLSLADLKLALRLDASDPTEDSFLVGLEAAAVVHLERVTGRCFGPPQEVTEFVMAEGATALWLRDEPQPTGDPPLVLVAVQSAGSAVDASTYRAIGRRITRPTPAAWGAPFWPAEFEITYTRGYEAGAEPPDARQAVQQLVTHWYENRGVATTGTIAPEFAAGFKEIVKALHGARGFV